MTIQALQQISILAAPAQQAQFGLIHPRMFEIEVPHITPQSFTQTIVVFDDRRQRTGQTGQIPVRHVWLLTKAIASLTGIGGIRRPVRVVFLHPPEGAVVERQAQHRKIVGVHHPMHKANPHPVRDHQGGALADRMEDGDVAIRLIGQLGEVALDHEIPQRAQQGEIAARARQLEVTEAQERRRDATDDGTRFVGGATVVKHVAQHTLARGDQTQCTRGRHTQRMHGFAADKFA